MPLTLLSQRFVSQRDSQNINPERYLNIVIRQTSRRVAKIYGGTIYVKFDGILTMSCDIDPFALGNKEKTSQTIRKYRLCLSSPYLHFSGVTRKLLPISSITGIRPLPAVGVIKPNRRAAL